jgi:hypothetical protein
MTDWTAKELDVIGAADELDIAPARPDGSLHPYTTIWIVRVGDELYVRSYRAAGVEHDVAFDRPRPKSKDQRLDVHGGICPSPDNPRLMLSVGG